LSLLDSKSKNIELIFNSEVEELFLWFDKYMMETIFYNLLSNAFKYSHVNGKIVLTLALDNEQLIISVQDFGQGISPEDLTHVFERFFQSKSHIGGSGIGLALVKRFVEAHKGTVVVESVFGEGSIFKANFLLGNKHFDKSNLFDIKNEPKLNVIQKETLAINTVYDRTLKNNTVLIVEDEVNLRGYLKTNLSHIYTILVAGNGIEALHVINDNEVDLIVSDVMMPEMGGVELCEVLKKDIKTSSIPIVLLTAKTQSEDKMLGYSKGVDSYLEKPFQLDVLQSRIDNLLEKRIKQKDKMLDALNISLDPESINSSDEKFYEKSIAIIEANIANPEFNIPMFTKELGMSKSLVYKKMSKITGLSINELILTVRLKRAAQMLIHTKKSIIEISFLVGFKNSKYFSTSFKKKFDLSPSVYRNQNCDLNKG